VPKENVSEGEERRRRQLGRETEDRFFAATSTELPGTPRWFHGMSRVTHTMDSLGIDAFARMEVPGYEWPLHVPIQIKRSWFYLGHYYIKRPYAKDYVLGIVVRPYFDASQIRARVFSLLGYIRQHPKDFDDFISSLVSKKHA
jgi:hypothetical protein